MNLILLCLLWVTLIEAHNFREQIPPYIGRRYHYGDPAYSLAQIHMGSRRQYPERNYAAQNHDRIAARAAETNEKPMNERSAHKMNEQLNERSSEQIIEKTLTKKSEDKMNERPLNERSIPVNSGIQRLQERRTQSRIDEGVSRMENGSLKIMNYPIISTRIAEVDEAMPSADSVVFPGPTSRSSVYVPEIPQECEEMGICEDVGNYPYDVVKNILNKIGVKKQMFYHSDEPDEPEIVQRLGGPEENRELCSFRKTLIRPQAAKNKDGNWYVILNQKDDPLQSYSVEICRKKDTPCDAVATFQRGYTSACRQKYVYRTMAAVDVPNQEIIYDMSFRVPSCCSCVAVHIGK